MGDNDSILMRVSAMELFYSAIVLGRSTSHHFQMVMREKRQRDSAAFRAIEPAQELASICVWSKLQNEDPKSYAAMRFFERRETDVLYLLQKYGITGAEIMPSSQGHLDYEMFCLPAAFQPDVVEPMLCGDLLVISDGLQGKIYSALTMREKYLKAYRFKLIFRSGEGPTSLP